MKQNVTKNQINTAIEKLLKTEYFDENSRMISIYQQIVNDVYWLNMKLKDVEKIIKLKLKTKAFTIHDYIHIMMTYSCDADTFNIYEVFDDFASDLINFIEHFIWAFELYK